MATLLWLIIRKEYAFMQQWVDYESIVPVE